MESLKYAMFDFLGIAVCTFISAALFSLSVVILACVYELSRACLKSCECAWRGETHGK